MKRIPSLYFLILYLLTSVTTAYAGEPPFLKYKDDAWVNQQLQAFTLEEKIAQLMMITVYPTQNDAS